MLNNVVTTFFKLQRYTVQIRFFLLYLFFKKCFHSCPPVAVVLARMRMAGERVETCDQLEFDVVEVADTMGWQLPLVKRGLRQLCTP